MSSIDSRGENEFADEESNLVGKSEECKEGEEKEDQTLSKKTEQKQIPKDESNSGWDKNVLLIVILFELNPSEPFRSFIVHANLCNYWFVML